jgi:ribonuclease H / adenosylcobalamin/alpha-ribazole phosphatase
VVAPVEPAGRRDLDGTENSVLQTARRCDGGLLLVRHGATAHTAEGRFSGCTGENPELSATGREQARRLAAELQRQYAEPSDARVAAVVSSPVRRARETAETVADAVGVPVGVDDDLREIDFGDWEGRKVEDVLARCPQEWAAWRADPTLAAPGGESVADVARRVRTARQRLTERHPDSTVVVVSHLYPVRLFVLDALGAPLEAVHRMDHDPTAVSELGLRDGSSTLLRYNDYRHLSRED